MFIIGAFPTKQSVRCRRDVRSIRVGCSFHNRRIQRDAVLFICQAPLQPFPDSVPFLCTPARHKKPATTLTAGACLMNCAPVPGKVGEFFSSLPKPAATRTSRTHHLQSSFASWDSLSSDNRRNRTACRTRVCINTRNRSPRRLMFTCITRSCLFHATRVSAAPHIPASVL